MKDKISDAVCTCKSCLEISKRRLHEARNKWDNGERKIVVNNWNTDEDYGTDVFINDFKVSTNGDDIEFMLESVMDFLQIDRIDIKVTYNGEEY